MAERQHTDDARGTRAAEVPAALEAAAAHIRGRPLPASSRMSFVSAVQTIALRAVAAATTVAPTTSKLPA